MSWTEFLIGSQNAQCATTELGQSGILNHLDSANSLDPWLSQLMSTTDTFLWSCPQKTRTEGARPTGLVESRSKLNQMLSLHLSTDRTQLASTWTGSLSLKLGCLNEPRDGTNKWLCGCLINTKGLAFEDLSTPGKMSIGEHV